MNAKTLEAITRHGETLLRAFPNATEKNPVALCKKLRRIENAVAKPILDYCNGENGVTVEQLDVQTDKALIRVEALLGMGQGMYLERQGDTLPGVFVNRDPRGYALKTSSEWADSFNTNCRIMGEPPLHQDWGHYGIIAPDLNQ
jgi:hypothetical protein